MRGADAFVDTNVLIYLFSDDETKKEMASLMLSRDRCIINIQVMMEFCSVYIKKYKHTQREARIALEMIRSRCSIVPVTPATIDRALDVQERYGYSFYDSVMIASALEHGCRYLFSEDMKHRQTIESTMIFDIFTA